MDAFVGHYQASIPKSTLDPSPATASPGPRRGLLSIVTTFTESPGPRRGLLSIVTTVTASRGPRRSLLSIVTTFTESPGPRRGLLSIVANSHLGVHPKNETSS